MFNVDKLKNVKSVMGNNCHSFGKKYDKVSITWTKWQITNRIKNLRIKKNVKTDCILDLVHPSLCFVSSNKLESNFCWSSNREAEQCQDPRLFSADNKKRTVMVVIITMPSCLTKIYGVFFKWLNNVNSLSSQWKLIY